MRRSKNWEKAYAVILAISLIVILFSIADNDVEAEDPLTDADGDGRPDEFETWQGLKTEENDVEWTFLVYCCGDDVSKGNITGTLLPEMWEFIEKLSWVGCTDDINVVVQFDGSDQLNGNHQDMFWNDMHNNEGKNINGTTTRRFLVGKDSKGWVPYLILDRNCTKNTVIDLYDVTDWDPKGMGYSHDSDNWEANMADPDTLEEFIEWGTETFPSDHYCLYIDSHGDGVNGFGYDHRMDEGPTTLKKDLLTLDEIQGMGENLTDKGISMDIVMLQSCLMGNIEFWRAFSSFTDHYVASENLMHLTGNQDDEILEQIRDDPDLTPKKVARKFIDVEHRYSRDGISNPPWNIMDWTGNERLTFSSVNTGKMMESSIIDRIYLMNSMILEGAAKDPGLYVPLLREAVSNRTCDHYITGLGYVQIDYYHFLGPWTNEAAVPDEVRNISREIQNILIDPESSDSAIEYEKHDPYRFNKTSGLAIYFPLNIGQWSSMEEEYRRSMFAKETMWDRVIDVYFADHPPSVRSPERITSLIDHKINYRFNVTELNGDPFSIEVVWTDAPFEIRELGDRTISFNGDRSGLFHALIRFQDTNGRSSMINISILVQDHNQAPSIELMEDLDLFLGVEYVHVIEVSDPNPNDDLSLSIEGEHCWIENGNELHFLADDTGEFCITVYLSDKNGSVVNTSFFVIVNERNFPPEGPSNIEISIEAGDRIRTSYSYSDPEGDIIELETISNEPDWFSFDFEEDLEIFLEPTNEAVGNWILFFQITDVKGNTLPIDINIKVLEPATPNLLLPEDMEVVERETLRIDLESDYELNGTVDFQLVSGGLQFISIMNGVMEIYPEDGDHGTYVFRIRTYVIGGGSRFTYHTVNVEQNLTELEIDIDTERTAYQTGDLLEVDIHYSGYSSNLDLSFKILQDGFIIGWFNRSHGEMELSEPGSVKIQVTIKGSDEVKKERGITVEKKEGNDERSLLLPIFIIFILLMITGTISILIYLKKRNDNDQEDEPYLWG